MVHGDTMYAFGGKSGRSPFNDLCGFSFEKNTWQQLKVDPTPQPYARPQPQPYAYAYPPPYASRPELPLKVVSHALQ